MTIHTLIKQARKNSNMSLSELARRTGISRGYLHRIENAESKPTFEKVSQIADALGVDVGTFADVSQPDADEHRLVYYWRKRRWAELLTMIAREIEMDERLWGEP